MPHDTLVMSWRKFNHLFIWHRFYGNNNFFNSMVFVSKWSTISCYMGMFSGLASFTYIKWSICNSFGINFVHWCENLQKSICWELKNCKSTVGSNFCIQMRKQCNGHLFEIILASVWLCLHSWMSIYITLRRR